MYVHPYVSTHLMYADRREPTPSCSCHANPQNVCFNKILLFKCLFAVKYFFFFSLTSCVYLDLFSSVQKEKNRAPANSILEFTFFCIEHTIACIARKVRLVLPASWLTCAFKFPANVKMRTHNYFIVKKLKLIKLK